MPTHAVSTSDHHHARARTYHCFRLFGFGFLRRPSAPQERRFGRPAAVAATADARLEGDRAVPFALAPAFALALAFGLFRGWKTVEGASVGLNVVYE